MEICPIHEEAMARVWDTEGIGVNNSTYHRLAWWVLNVWVLIAVKESSQIHSVTGSPNLKHKATTILHGL